MCSPSPPGRSATWTASTASSCPRRCCLRAVDSGWPTYTNQTNATLIDDEWAAFFKDHGFLVGVSSPRSSSQHQGHAHDRVDRVAATGEVWLDKRDTLPRFCRECDVRFACHGGCPKDRFTDDPYGEPGLNYLCPSFKAFFHHVDGPMRTMSELVRAGRAPSELVHAYAADDAKRDRNDPCTCGSGRRWKLCHGAA